MLTAARYWRTDTLAAFYHDREYAGLRERRSPAVTSGRALSKNKSVLATTMFSRTEAQRSRQHRRPC